MDNFKEKIDLGHYWDLKGYKRRNVSLRKGKTLRFLSVPRKKVRTVSNVTLLPMLALFQHDFVSGRRIKFSGKKYLTIIGRGWAKYRDLSVVRRSIIYRSKSRDIAIIEFNNCFIIRSPSLFLMQSDLPLSLKSDCKKDKSAVFIYVWGEHYLQPRILFAAKHSLTWWGLGHEREEKSGSNDNFI